MFKRTTKIALLTCFWMLCAVCMAALAFLTMDNPRATDLSQLSWFMAGFFMLGAFTSLEP